MSEYDTAGRLSAQLDPFGERTEYVYDDANRQISVTDPKDNTSTTVYGPQGGPNQRLLLREPRPMVMISRVIDAKQNSTFHEYDKLSRMIQTTVKERGRSSLIEQVRERKGERKGTQLID